MGVYWQMQLLQGRGWRGGVGKGPAAPFGVVLVEQGLEGVGAFGFEGLSLFDLVDLVDGFEEEKVESVV